MTSPNGGGLRRTVWILGAGFSKGLGGPLIKDLLAHREKGVLDSLFPSDEYPLVADEVFTARLFYNWGAKRGYWDNAEQFLDIVESATAEKRVPLSYAHSLLTSMLRGTVRYPEKVLKRSIDGSGVHSEAPGAVYQFESLSELATASRRALAVDCSVFLRAAQLESERWSPYKEWAESLGKRDTVVTFNYDQIPEILATDIKSNLEVIHPERVADELEEAKSAGETPVLKVHGSVTWRLVGERIDVVPMGDRMIGDPSIDPVIGVPGPGKRMLIRKTLKAMWNAALDEIRSAGHVIFVGYRFPPTDADSRRDLLGALHDNRHGGVAPVVQTVLGPEVGGPDSVRIKRLIESATTGRVTALPFFAEDFIGLRKRLRL